MKVSPRYPTMAWIRAELKWRNIESRVKYKVLAAFIVGSEARGTAKANSDLDIAVVIPPVRGKSSLRVSENYHGKFRSERGKPHWQGRIVDFQFFYPGEIENMKYAKIPLNSR